jgi:hypothetical protein
MSIEYRNWAAGKYALYQVDCAPIKDKYPDFIFLP